MTEALLLVVAGLLGFLALEVRRHRPAKAGNLEVPRSSETSTEGGAPQGELDVLVKAALDALSIGVVIASRSGEVVYRNQTARGLTGSVHSDVLVDEAVDIHLRAAVSGRSGSRVLDLFGPPRRVLSVSATPLVGGGAVATVDDITERSLLDAVRTDFVANISHELKTPIGAIIVLAEAICDSDDDEVVKRLSNKMVTEAVRAGHAVDDLLELSRIELGGEAVKDPVDVEAVISEAVDRYRPLSDKCGITIVVNVPEVPIRMVGDRRQIASALGNMIENAIKYSDSDSRITVTASGDDGWVEMKVRDWGIGIPGRDIDRIFERFYRVDRARSRETGGTGLGLAIVRHVATNHGGEVKVSSVEGEGSEFTLRIPAVRQQTSGATDESSRSVSGE